MKKIDIGLTQLNQDSPAWLVKIVAVIATVNLCKEAIISGIPIGNADTIMVWADWSISVLNMMVAIAAALAGRSK